MHPQINNDDYQRKELTSPDGRDMGHMTKEGSNWYIYDKSGSYVGRIDENGFITNRRGDNLGRVN